MATMSPLPLPRRTRLRTAREPLSTLPITLFIPPANTLPSPVSLSFKRGPSSSTEEIGGSSRKVSRTEEKTPKAEGSRTQTPVKSASTPRRVALSRDELGTGKSPVRRLFSDATRDDGHRISGISGAIATPPSVSTPSSSHRGRAPSPPIPDPPRASSQPSPFLVSAPQELDAFGLDGVERDMNVSIHDVGFVIYEDIDQPSSSKSTGLRTPRSRRANDASSTPTISLPSSPISSIHELELENQENIPPPANSDSPAQRYTPSKYDSESDVSGYLSVSSYSRSPSASGSGSGTRRRERSKLANEVYNLRGEAAKVDDEPTHAAVRLDGEEEEEELTPGKKILDTKEKGKARERLAMEVDAI